MTLKSISNPLAAVVQMLLDDLNISQLCGNRVYGSELPRNQAKEQPRAALVLRPSGGGSIGPGARSWTPWTVMRLDVTAYGKDPDEAINVHWAAYRAFTDLERTVIANCILHNAVVTGGPITGRDGDTDWPFVLGVYDVSAVLEN